MAVRSVKGRKPKHQMQIGRSPTGSFDCGPRSWQMGIDVQTGGRKRPGPTKLRKLAGRLGSVTTRAEDADKAVERFGRNVKGFKKPLRYRVKLQRPWAEAEKALRNRRAVHIAIDYGVINRNSPELSSQLSFNGGHSILLFGIRRNGAPGGKGWEIGVNDPLARSRRWWPLGLIRYAAGRIAGRPRHFYGGIFIPGLREVAEVDPPDPPAEAEEDEIPGAPKLPEAGEAVTDPASEFDDDGDDDIDDDETGITDGNLLDPQYPEDDPAPDEMGHLDGDVDPDGRAQPRGTVGAGRRGAQRRPTAANAVEEERRMLFGIDISHHQSGRVPFPLTAQSVADEKLSFILIKATQGTCPPGTWTRPWNFRDSWFLRHLKMARDAGVPVVGAYHYLLADTPHTGSGRLQAEFFVRAIERTAKDGEGLLLAVDFEGSDWVASLDAPADYSPRWRDLKGFVKRFRALLPEHPLLVYTSPGYAGRLGAHDLADLDPRTFAWNAEWPDMRPARPGTQTYAGRLGALRPARIRTLGGWTPGWGGYSRTTILQFTDRAMFATRRVDADAFEGTLADLRALAASRSQPSASAADRRAYRRGYNRLVDAVVVGSATIAVPGGEAAFEKGVADARADIAERLPDWRLRAGDDA